MDDYMLRFAECTDRTDISTCTWPIARKGLIVGIFSIGTLVGSLGGSWCVFESLFLYHDRLLIIIAI